MLTYGEAARLGPQVAGGKGWNLGRLHEFGFRVPAGGVLDASAYRAALGAPDLAPLLERARAITAETAADKSAASDLARLRERIETLGIPEDATHAVSRFLAESALDGARLAVRSSATAEDGAEASFAGIHGSFLNVEGVDAVCEAIARCFATLWTPQAVAYRRRLGLDDDAVACAVVLCEMVGGPDGVPAAAGVAFSCDPQTGRRDQIMIDAARGLGDAVVSGSVNPDRIVVPEFVGFVSGDRVERVGTAEAALSNDQALELARVVHRIQWALGDGQDPQDVEWAHDGDHFWIVQSRPVTRLPRVGFPEVAHLPTIWSNANLKDAVPGVLTVLSWDSVATILTACLYGPMQSVGGVEVPDGMRPFRRIRGRSYFDLTNMEWFIYDLFGLMPREMTEGLGGHQPEIPVPPGDPLKGPEGKRRKKATLDLLKAAWRNRKTYDAEIARIRRLATSNLQPVLETKSRAELLSLLGEYSRETVGFSYPFQMGNHAAGMWPTMLTKLLQKRLGERTQSVVSGLMAGSRNIVSAEHGYRLFDLAAAAADDDDARAYLASTPIDPVGWRTLPNGSPFKRAFESFLDDFGHRAVYEGEFSKPRWNEDPTFLLEQVRELLAHGLTAPPVGAADATRRAAESALGKVFLPVRLVARFLAGKAREAAAQREAGKSALVALAMPPRRLVLEVGRRMVNEGHLASRDDAFHLAWIDIESYLRSEWDGTGAGTLAASRAAQRLAWLAEDSEDIYILDPEGNPAKMPSPTGATGATGARPKDVQDASGKTLTGVGVAAGRASGAARTILHPDESGRLQRGEVLVAPSTDPGWTPLFLRASAVVMEVGGYLSHGAIVAREYGLPAVVNIPGLLKRVNDGDALTVNGDAGVVTIGEPS
jgi:rifampicin phosphotransferase